MRQLIVALLLPINMLLAQAPDSAPPLKGNLKGTLLEWSGKETAGEFSFRTLESRVIWCRYDGKSLFENNGVHINIGGLRVGDHIEVLADSDTAPDRCYARTVKVVVPPPVTSTRPKLTPYRAVTESIVPRGNLTFSGVVLKLGTDTLILRTRDASRKVILLRADTRYVEDGAPVGLAKLVPNQRVFIRAGKTFEDEIEAYMVSWGEILQAH